ncbi:polyamine deacetylase HDAC10 isoform X1 [Alosa sapidissima]|uniref:polyamine deacetylase HDAC10 isoform X1 n=1 Tax=Alosa sapidissima TaxID=34773 RepID=UPI001C09F8B5|nr:polyamine deacetylase HDAC10 isoform X1 [Alosa sapidissima]
MASKTALIYDEEMTRYKLLWVDPACKIEVPERLTASYGALLAKGLSERCVSIPVRQATDEEILLVHSEEYLEAVKQTPHMTLEDLMTFTQQYGDVYFHPNIFHCAKLAIGATLQLVDSVMTEKVRNGIALVRPPGHHSQRSAANGFCVFNNVAIAAHYAKKRYSVKRVLIVDWDVHHGQGVQYCFEEDPSVLYFSWHRFEHQSFWPNLPESDYDNVGKGNGAGFNMNVPWNKVGMTNSDYLSVFFHVLLPVAYEFNPELVLVSAGFDSAIGDPEGHMCATPEIFAHLTHLLMPLAGGRLCTVLEGGYHLTSLAQSVCQTVQSLLGDPAPLLPSVSSPCDSALESLQNVRSAHQPYWTCFKHSATAPVSEPSTKHCRTQGGAGEEVQPEQLTGQAEEQTEEEVVWPEPLPRTAPPVRTAAALPAGGEDTLPQGCRRSVEAPHTMGTVQRLGDELNEEVKDERVVRSLRQVISLLDQVEKKEIRNGLAVVPDISLAVKFAVQHALSSTDRVLVVFVGDGELSVDSHDGRVLLVQICSKQPKPQTSQYHVSVCLKQGPGDVAGFLHSVLVLLLPLAYELSPGLVLEVLAHSSVTEAAWAQLTSLLQGLALGHTLALLQESQGALVRASAASLMGDPVPALGPQGPLSPEDVRTVEEERRRLEVTWGMLHTSVAGKKSLEQNK